MAPQDLSIGHSLKKLLLAEGTQLTTRDVDASHLNLLNVELLHHPYCPVDHLICRPLHGV